METNRSVFRVERKDICYVQSIIESYDGMGFVSTIDPHGAIIEIRIPPGCEADIQELIESLNRHDNVIISRLENLTGS